jgi:hypothetical protein
MALDTMLQQLALSLPFSSFLTSLVAADKAGRLLAADAVSHSGSPADTLNVVLLDVDEHVAGLTALLTRLCPGHHTLPS